MKLTEQQISERLEWAWWLWELEDEDMQGRRLLFRDDEDSFCCLGVAVCVGLARRDLSAVTTGTFSGFSYHCLPYFITANDKHKMSFAQIADAIVMSTTRPSVPIGALLREVRESDEDHASAREEE